MKVTATRFGVVTIEADQRSIEVFQQGDGKFKCLTCNRYRCEHVKFVQSQNVELPKHAPATVSDDNEILTY